MVARYAGDGYPFGSLNLRCLLKGTDIAANEAGAAETVVVEIMRFGDGESVTGQ
jgi:hypothetical protein